MLRTTSLESRCQFANSASTSKAKIIPEEIYKMFNFKIIFNLEVTSNCIDRPLLPHFRLSWSLAVGMTIPSLDPLLCISTTSQDPWWRSPSRTCSSGYLCKRTAISWLVKIFALAICCCLITKKCPQEWHRPILLALLDNILIKLNYQKWGLILSFSPASNWTFRWISEHGTSILSVSDIHSAC